MSKTNNAELIITGNITKDELKKAEKELSKEGVTVYRGFTKGIEVEEVLQLILRDFDAYTLLRDGILFTFLLDKSKKIFGWFKENILDKNKTPRALWVHVIFEKDGKVSASVNLFLPDDEQQTKLVVDELKKKFTLDYLDSVEEQELWSISYDNETKNVEIENL